MTYPSPTTVNLTSSEGLGNLFEYVNLVTNFWFGRMLMIAVFILFFIGYLKSKPDDDVIGAFAIAGYVTFVLGLLAWLIKLLDGLSFAIIIGIALVSSVVLFIYIIVS